MMTLASVAIQPTAETLAIPEALAEAHPPPMETVVLEVTMELAREVLPEARAEVLVPDEEIGTREGVMEIPIDEGLRTSGVHLDVVGSNAVVTME